MKADKQQLFIKLDWMIGRLNEKSIIHEVDLSTGESVNHEVNHPVRPFSDEEFDQLHLLLIDVIDTCFAEELKEAKQKQLDELYKDSPDDYEFDWQYPANR